MSQRDVPIRQASDIQQASTWQKMIRLDEEKNQPHIPTAAARTKNTSTAVSAQYNEANTEQGFLTLPRRRSDQASNDCRPKPDSLSEGRQI